MNAEDGSKKFWKHMTSKLNSSECSSGTTPLISAKESGNDHDTTTRLYLFQPYSMIARWHGTALKVLGWEWYSECGELYCSVSL